MSPKRMVDTKMVPVPSHSIVPERDVDKTPVLETRHLGIEFGGLKAYRHYRSGSEKPAEFYTVADFFAVSRDKTDGSCLAVDHSYRHFVGDYRGNCRSGSVSRNGYHIKTYRADGGHRFEFRKGKRSAFGGGDHSGVFGNGDKRARKPSDLA